MVRSFHLLFLPSPPLFFPYVVVVVVVVHVVVIVVVVVVGYIYICITVYPVSLAAWSFLARYHPFSP